MEVLERRAMANTNKGEIAINKQLVKLLLSLHIKGTGRLIQNNKTWRVQQQSPKGQSLLFSKGKDARPILLDVQIGISHD